MPHFLVQASFTAEAARGLIAGVQDREAAARAVLEAAGGKLHAFYYAFGPTDVVIIAEYPSNIDAAAVSMAVASSGAFSKYETIPLLTNEEAMAAFRKAQAVQFRSPSG